MPNTTAVSALIQIRAILVKSAHNGRAPTVKDLNAMLKIVADALDASAA